MRNIWITVAYDGTDFSGFQRQENGLAVQEVIEQVIRKLTGTRTTLYFSSRTDAGVHAWSQECTFYTESNIPADRFLCAMNTWLPLSIRIRKSREMPMDFSVRRMSLGKTYVYLIAVGSSISPFLSRYVWKRREMPDISLMSACAECLTGEHDFTAFRGNNSVPASPVRRIYDISIIPDSGLVRIYVTGNGFLYHMVRNIAGALADAGRGKLNSDDVRRILRSRDRTRLGATAPAAGLCLLHVYFKEITEEAIHTVQMEPVFPWNR